MLLKCVTLDERKSNAEQIEITTVQRATKGHKRNGGCIRGNVGVHHVKELVQSNDQRREQRSSYILSLVTTNQEQFRKR